MLFIFGETFTPKIDIKIYRLLGPERYYIEMNPQSIEDSGFVSTD